MGKWVSVGVVFVLGAGLASYVALREKDPDDPSPRASPVPSVVDRPSPSASPSSSPSPKPSSAPSPSLSGPVLAADGQRAASNLEANVGCSGDEPDQGFVDLKWTVAPRQGREQKLQLTIYREGFETGRFETSESLAPDLGSYRWSRVEGQAVHYWRVLTLQSEGWIPSETARFEGPSCVRT